MASRPQFVFGYGSLAARSGPVLRRRFQRHGFIADLPGFARTWGVAMDNRHDLPGYKYYTDEAGRRPAAFVTFLDVRCADAATAAVNGLCLPVGESDLLELDRREHNYERVDVSDRIDAGGAQVWTFMGNAAGRARLEAGRRLRRAVIDAHYLRAVEAAFWGLGEAEHRLCRPSLEPGGLPVAELTRHELPRPEAGAG
jgi:hypothetical protein